MPEKYKPQSVTQEEYDALPPDPKSRTPIDAEEDDFMEIFLANLNENTREKTPEEQAEYERETYPNVP